MRRFCPFPSRARPPRDPRPIHASNRMRQRASAGRETRAGAARLRPRPAPAALSSPVFPQRRPSYATDRAPVSPPARPSPPRRATAKLRVPRPAHARFSGPPGRLQAACEPLFSREFAFRVTNCDPTRPRSHRRRARNPEPGTAPAGPVSDNVRPSPGRRPRAAAALLARHGVCYTVRWHLKSLRYVARCRRKPRALRQKRWAALARRGSAACAPYTARGLGRRRA